MIKKTVSICLSLSFLLSQGIHADEPVGSEEPVGQAAAEGASSSKEMWKNVALVSAAIAVATAAIIVVGLHSGKRVMCSE